jgi:hypothetical protein
MIVGILLQAPVGAQQPAGDARPARAPLPGTAHAAPRTPWGDPDLQGDYTNKYEQGTPFERPAEFDGRRQLQPVQFYFRLSSRLQCSQ